MAWLGGVVLTAVGWALTLAVEWLWQAGASLPGALPRWSDPLVPTLAVLALGAYLALVVGGRPARWLMVLQAAVALGVVGVPLAYTYGLAARYGLPAQAGPLAALLAGPLAREVAAVWLVLALGQALRRPARTPVLLPAGHAARAPVPPPFWEPSPLAPGTAEGLATATPLAADPAPAGEPSGPP